MDYSYSGRALAPDEAVVIHVGGLKEELQDIMCEIEETLVMVDSRIMRNRCVCKQIDQLKEYIRQMNAKLGEMPDEQLSVNNN